jgi:cytochrome c-type biogenesis protein CcmH/NrfG
VRNAVEAESHLKRLIEADPRSAFLWNRLGNVYVSADERMRAIPTFEKALQLNPLDMESLHSLGECWFQQGHYVQAAPYYHQILRHCRKGTWYREDVKEPLIRDALESLMEMRHKTHGKIELFPPPEKTEVPQHSDEPPVLVLQEFDLSSEQGWDRIVHFFLHGPPDKRAPGNASPAPLQKRLFPPTTGRSRPAPAPAPTSRERVGRNDPCPCGSGKKFKHCCHRR